MEQGSDRDKDRTGAKTMKEVKDNKENRRFFMDKRRLVEACR